MCAVPFNMAVRSSARASELLFLFLNFVFNFIFVFNFSIVESWMKQIEDFNNLLLPRDSS